MKEGETTEIMQELLRVAFVCSETNYKGIFWSFSQNPGGSWQHEDNTTRCYACKECISWRDWHCETCGKCTYGISIPCSGCDEVCKMYHSVKDDIINGR
jgi:hypothetical protein